MMVHVHIVSMKLCTPPQYLLTGLVKIGYGEKAKAREQKSLVDFVPPKQDIDSPVTEVITDDIPFSKLTIRSDSPDKNPTEVTDTLISPLEVAADIPAIKTPEAET